MARERGISRDQLYAEAIESYVALFRDEDVAARLNAVDSEAEAKLDPELQELQTRTIFAEEW